MDSINGGTPDTSAQIGDLLTGAQAVVTATGNNLYAERENDGQFVGLLVVRDRAQFHRAITNINDPA